MKLRALPLAVVVLYGPPCGESGSSSPAAVVAEDGGNVAASDAGNASPPNAVEASDGEDADGEDAGGEEADAEPTPVDRLRAAREAMDAERWSEAASGFHDLLGTWPDVDDAVRYRAMESAFRAGDLAVARADAEVLASGGGRHAFASRARLAEIALAERRFDDAVARFRELIEGTVPRRVDKAGLKLSLARALEGAGEAAEARREYELLVRFWPESPRSNEAEARLRAIDPSFSIPPEWRLDRAAELVKHRDWAEAIDELDLIPPGTTRPPPETVAWERAMALFTHRRRYDEAERAFAVVVEMEGPHEADAAFYRARSLARDHRDADAIESYRAFARKYPRNARAGDARYLAATLELYLGRFDDAIDSLEALVGRNRTGPALPDTRWSLALAYLLADRPADALELIDGTADDGETGLIRGRALYWGAVARLDLGRRDEAIAMLGTVIRDFPLHWYALLARNRLESLDTDVPPPLASRSGGRSDPDPRCDDLPAGIAALREAGLADDARAYLVAALRPEVAGATGETLRTLTRRLLCVDAVDLVADHVRADHDAETFAPLDDDTRPFWEASWPRAWRGLVEPACAREEVSPHVLWAIMRQESSYDPDVVSRADAIGLLQMIPPTTRRILEARGEPYDDAILFDPARNVALGAYYIAWIGRKFHGQVPLQAAGFNGGPHNVERWLGEFGETRLDRFVERIPFGQTKNYVRRVVTSWAHYLYLWETDGNDWPVRLPEQIRTDCLPEPDF